MHISTTKNAERISRTKPTIPIVIVALVLAIAVACNVDASPTTSAPSPVAVPQSGTGQVYYVATDGEDVVPGGTSDNPWRTLQFAVEQVGPGDTILVRSGTYVGCRIESSGTANDWITLKAAPGADVQVNAPGPDNVHDSNIEIETWEGDGTVSYWVIEGFEVANAPGWGIDMRGSADSHSHHLIVRSNAVHHNGVSAVKTGIFTAFVDDVVIEENETYANGEHGIYHSNSGDRPIIRGNISHDNGNCGIHMNADAGMGGDGVISNGLVESNIIYENGTGGGSAINMDGVADTIVRNNLLYDNHAGGIAIFQQDGGVCSQNNRVLNNTIVMPADGRWAINITQSGCVNNQLFNNIIYSYHSYRGSITIPDPAPSGFESDYNTVLDRFSADGDNTIISLAQWQALGYDTHSMIATPPQLFEGPDTDDYHLKADSPAIDTGTYLVDVTDDIEGNARPTGSTHDIGAYEYQHAGFILNVYPSEQAINSGGVARYTISAEASGGFSAALTLIAASPSPSLTLSLNPALITPGMQATLTVSDTHTGPLAPGMTVTIPITASGGGFSQTASVALLVGGTQAHLPLALR